MYKSISGQVALVTGAAGGLGWATAVRLAAEGARLVLVDRDAEGLERLRMAIDVEHELVAADVALESEVDHYVDVAVRSFGRVDYFYNNAGVEGRLAPMTELSVQEFDEVMAVNVRGVFLGLRAVLRVMKDQGAGGVVNTASMAAYRGVADFAPYVASKHAVAGLTRCAALEGAPFGIRVNGIAPGHIDTRMAHALNIQQNPMDPESVRDEVSRHIPLGRYGTASEVANLVTWLFSSESSYVSGHTYRIDGAVNA